MMCYRDRTYCGSDVKEHTCGRELKADDELKASEMGMPIAYGNFCEEESKRGRGLSVRIAVERFIK